MVQAAVLVSAPPQALAPVREPSGAEWIVRLASPIVGSETGSLAGLTFAVKDNIDVAGVATTAGCPAFAYRPVAHATVVRKLIGAGARVAGKTNLDQFACGLNGTRSPYGAVPNAFNLLYVSGGSSSGSAYVVATGQVDFALGTDTAGSGRVPAGLNNIVGLKPSKGLISTAGVVPAAKSVDCVSIFARTVDMAVRVLQAAMGHDAADPFSRSLALATQPFGNSFRFGVPSALEFFGDELSRAAFDDAMKMMRVLGGVPVAIDYEPLAQAAALLYESALVAERYAAIREFFDAHPNEVIEPVRGIIASGTAYSAADLYQAQEKLQALGQRANAMWESIDVLLVPTAPTHYTMEQMREDPVALNRNLGAYTNFVNLLDYAALSVPSTIRPDGLPFGITLVGRCGSDWQLAQLGQRYHHATGLTLGATGETMPQPRDIGALCLHPHLHPEKSASTFFGDPGDPPPAGEGKRQVQVAVVGAHLSGMPLNSQLVERGARLLRVAETAPHYRFFALPGTTPPKPGLLRVEPDTGARIALEVWEMPVEHFGSFVALIPAPLGIATLELADGASVQGFVCEAQATRGAQDISHHGGWRAYITSIASLATT